MSVLHVTSYEEVDILTPDHMLTEDLPPALLCSFGLISIMASLAVS